MVSKSVLFCFFAAFGGWVFGYDIGYISGCLIMPDFVKQFGEWNGTEYVLSSQRQSIITSLLSAGTFFGALLQTLTSDRLGRKYSIMFWSAIFTVGTIIQLAAFGLAQITVGRFVSGLGVGALSAIVPLFIGEAAPKHIRGSLLVLYQVQIVSGLFLAYIIDLATHKIPSSASWRIPIGIQILWGILLCIGAWLLPESPRLLLGKGKEQAALKSIAALNNCSVEDPVAQEMLLELEEAVAIENAEGKGTWLELFSRKGHMWKRTVNGMMIQFLQQMCAQNFYYYYGPVFFQAARIESLDSYTIQVILGAVSFVMVLPALWTIEHVGRRRSLIAGATFMCACAIITGLVGHFYTDDPSVSDSKRKLGGNVLIAFAVLHVSAFSLFWGPAPWVILGETFPLRVRPKGIALGSATNWFWNFMLGYFSPLIAGDIGPLIMLIFAGVLLVAVIYVFFCIPETRRLSLEEVDEMYRSGTPAWKTNGWKPAVRDHHISEDDKEAVHAEHIRGAAVLAK